VTEGREDGKKKNECTVLTVAQMTRARKEVKERFRKETQVRNPVMSEKKRLKQHPIGARRDQHDPRKGQGEVKTKRSENDEMPGGPEIKFISQETERGNTKKEKNRMAE